MFSVKKFNTNTIEKVVNIMFFRVAESIINFRIKIMKETNHNIPIASKK